MIPNYTTYEPYLVVSEVDHISFDNHILLGNFTQISDQHLINF